MRDLVPACNQNSEHVSWLHALCEAIGYLRAVSSLGVDLGRTPAVDIKYRLAYGVELYL